MRKSFVVSLFAFAIFQLVVQIPYEIGLADEGFQFYLAWAVGKKSIVLYHDMFTMYAPGYVWTMVAFFEIFEYSFFWYRIYDVLLIFAVVVGLYIIGSKITKSKWSNIYLLAFLVLAWIPIFPRGKASRIIFVLLFIHLSISIIHTKITRKQTTGLGLTVTGAGVMSQEVGGFLTISFISLLAIQYFDDDIGAGMADIVDRFSIFVAVGLVGTSPIILYYWLNDGAQYLFHDLVFSLSSFSDAMALPLTRPISLVISNFSLSVFGIINAIFYSAQALLFMLPIILFVFVGYHIFNTITKERDILREDRVLIFITIISILFYTIALGRTDRPHLAIAIPISILLLSVIVDRWWLSSSSNIWNMQPKYGQVMNKIKFRDILLPVLAVGILFASAGVGQALFVISSVNPSTDYVDSELSTANNLKINENRHENISRSVNVVNNVSDTDSTLVVLPYQPGYYPLSNKSPPTRFSSFLPGEMDGQDVSDVITQMEEERVIVVYNSDRTIRTHRGSLEVEDYYPRLHNYIINDCEYIKTVGRSDIYVC